MFTKLIAGILALIVALGVCSACNSVGFSVDTFNVAVGGFISGVVVSFIFGA